MKKLILCITFLLTVQVIVAQSTYKTEMENGSDSYIEIQIGTRSVTIIGHDKDEIIITTDFSGELTFCERSIRELEKASRGQSKSYVWKRQHKGRITASHFHDVNAKVKKLMRKNRPISEMQCLHF